MAIRGYVCSCLEGEGLRNNQEGWPGYEDNCVVAKGVLTRSEWHVKGGVGKTLPHKHPHIPSTPPF